MKCELCGDIAELKKSHVIPKFIYRWIKKTSPYSGLRNVENPNIRYQDGHKEKLLCGKCEQYFSKFEKSFNETYFTKLTNGVSEEIEVTEDLIKFTVSLFWRSLFLQVKNRNFDKLYEHELKEIDTFLLESKKNLSGINNNLTDSYKFHIIPTTEKMEELDKIPNNRVTNQRGTAENAAAFSLEKEGYDYLIYYIKLPYLLLVVEIISNNNISFENTELKLGEKILNENIIQLPEVILKCLDDIDNIKNNAINNLSEQQQYIIQEKVKKIISEDPTAIETNQTIKALVYDLKKKK